MEHAGTYDESKKKSPSQLSEVISLPRTRVDLLARMLAVFLFGIAIPAFLAVQAYINATHLTAGLLNQSDDIVETYAKLKPMLNHGNDYVLISLMNAEKANQRTMVNKQVMKSVIMQLGFAVVSIGIMLIAQGINDGGAELKSGGGEVAKLEFKSKSSGVVVFAIGAVLVSLGAWKNDYGTVPIPQYEGEIEASSLSLSVSAYQGCQKESDSELAKCFLKKFEAINKEILK